MINRQKKSAGVKLSGLTHCATKPRSNGFYSLILKPSAHIVKAFFEENYFYLVLQCLERHRPLEGCVYFINRNPLRYTPKKGGTLEKLKKQSIGVDMPLGTSESPVIAPYEAMPSKNTSTPQKAPLQPAMTLYKEISSRSYVAGEEDLIGYNISDSFTLKEVLYIFKTRKYTYRTSEGNMKSTLSGGFKGSPYYCGQIRKNFIQSWEYWKGKRKNSFSFTLKPIEKRNPILDKEYLKIFEEHVAYLGRRLQQAKKARVWSAIEIGEKEGLHCHFVCTQDANEEETEAYVRKIIKECEDVELSWAHSGEMDNMINYITKMCSYDYRTIAETLSRKEPLTNWERQAATLWYVADTQKVTVFRHPRCGSGVNPHTVVKRQPHNVKLDGKDPEILKHVSALDLERNIEKTLEYFANNTVCCTLSACKTCGLSLWLQELQRRKEEKLPYIGMVEYLEPSLLDNLKGDILKE